MSLKFLLDTNILSEKLRAVPNPGIVKKIAFHDGEIATAAPVWHELFYGCRVLPPSKKRRAIEKYLLEVVAPTVPILPYDASAAEWHASERARLTRLGRTPPFVDGQIAAVARLNGLEVVTTNVEDYLDFEGITVRDWRS